jgi:prepilin-type N-terminal cleavage/methylation domain-containing protein
MMSKNGFTLIELIIVLTIIFILLAIAGISGRTWLDKYRVESQMKQMFVDLMNARVSAMQKNRPYFVVLTATQYTIYEDTNLLSPKADGSGVLETGTDRVVVQKNLNPLYSITSGAGEIDFNEKGLVSAGLVGTQTTIRVTASFGSAYDCIVVSSTNIRMGAWNGTSCVVQ